jgi:hypothetical protein
VCNVALGPVAAVGLEHTTGGLPAAGAHRDTQRQYFDFPPFTDLLYSWMYCMCLHSGTHAA